MQLTLFEDATDCPTQLYCGKTSPAFLSTRDNAFGCFLAALLGESKELVPTRGRWTGAGIVRSDECEIAWRILDAQYFGVPQRRRRVFLIAGNRDRRAAQILFEQPSKSRNPETGGKKGKESATFIEGSFGTFQASNTAGTLKRTGGALSGGSETLIVNIGATLSTGFGGRDVDSDQICNGNCVITFPEVRKLTPVECERLQGFPDNYTRITWRNKPAEQCPDTPRYMAIGNSMAVPVMRWIGSRIK